MITELPLSPTKEDFNQRLASINLSQLTDDESTFDSLKTILESKDLWAKYSHLKHFTGNFNFVLRNRQIKQHFKPAFLRKECALSIATERLLTMNKTLRNRHKHDIL